MCQHLFSPLTACFFGSDRKVVCWTSKGSDLASGKQSVPLLVKCTSEECCLSHRVYSDEASFRVVPTL